MSILADDPRPLAPVQPEERIVVLDVLRGFALLGICVINLPGFYMPWFFYSAGEEPYPGFVDQGALWLINFLGSGKFNSLFSFLFGIGFAIQMGRAEARGGSFAPVYLRRLLVLFAIGVAHCLLIWSGDVLHIYALIGVPLLLVRKISDRWLWTVAGLLLLVPIGKDVYHYYRQTADPHDHAYWRERAENELRVYGQGSYDEFVAPFTKTAPATPRSVVGRGSYPDAVKERYREISEGYLEHGDAWFWPILGTSMTIGFLVGRRRIFQDLNPYLPGLRKMTLWTGIAGLALAGSFATFSLLADNSSRTPTPLGTLSGVFYVLNRLVVCAFYVGVIVLLAQKPGWRSAMRPLTLVGRMPLTNYLMQSIIASVIFYGYGFGFYGRIGPAAGILIAMGIYAFQVVYSMVWMSFFRFGPMEWLWRTLSYGKAPAMRTPAATPETAPA